MQAGIAQYGRTILAAFSAALMVISMMFVFADPADADHIPDTGPVPDNCVNFQAGETGTLSPVDYPSVDITLDSWADTPSDPHTVNFTISGLASGQYVDLSVKSGTTEQEVGPYGNGSHSYSNGLQNAISHVRLCVFVESSTTTTTAPTTTTTQPTTTTTVQDTTTTTVEDTTTTTPPEVGEIVVQKVVLGEGGTGFEFTFNTGGFTLADNTLAHGQSSSSGDIPAGDGYSVSEELPSGWNLVSAACDDGSDPSNIEVDAGETVTCTFTNTIEDEVQASILVTVAGTCVEDDGEGEGVISVNVSVDGGATIVIRDSDGDVVGTFTEDGSVTVPEGETYTWVATASEGFEFPADAATSGSITIETCSDPEVLPFTGLNLDTMAIAAGILMAAGMMILFPMRKGEEA